MLMKGIHDTLIKWIVLLFFIWFIAGNNAIAADWTNRVTINGFASAIYQQTDETAAINGSSNKGGIDNRGSFHGSKLGINMKASVNDKTTLYTQLLGAQGANNFNMDVSWAFINFELSDTLSLRTGKIKFPVGIVNEYVDVGFTYPWLTAPIVMYSTIVPAGSQVTREAYTGASLLWQNSVGDWTLDADFFAGEVKMDVADVRKTRGITVRADWDDQVLLQASTYTGVMENAITGMTAMNQQPHDVSTLGVKVNMNNILAYAEIATVTMGAVSAMAADTLYVTLGYRIGKLLPYISYENFEKGTPVLQKQNFTSLGLRYDIMNNTALKFQFSSIKTEKGNGLFATTPSSNSTNQFGIGVDIIF